MHSLVTEATPYNTSVLLLLKEIAAKKNILIPQANNLDLLY